MTPQIQHPINAMRDQIAREFQAGKLDLSHYAGNMTDHIAAYYTKNTISKIDLTNIGPVVDGQNNHALGQLSPVKARAAGINYGTLKA